MKVKPDSLDALKRQLSERSQGGGLSYSEIGRKADVHPSQVSRICRGQFKSVSQNVVQICSALGLSIEGFVPKETSDPAAALLINGILGLWKGTPEDAQRITGLLDRLAELRTAS